MAALGTIRKRGVILVCIISIIIVKIFFQKKKFFKKNSKTFSKFYWWKNNNNNNYIVYILKIFLKHKPYQIGTKILMNLFFSLSLSLLMTDLTDSRTVRSGPTLIHFFLVTYFCSFSFSVLNTKKEKSKIIPY